MLGKYELTIILVIILVLIYLFEGKEHFASSNFRLKLKGTSNVFLYNQQYKGFTTSTGGTSGAYYILGFNKYLICDQGYKTKIYDDKCLYYKQKDNANNYLIEKNSSYSSSSTNCSSSSNPALYFDDSFIYYFGSNNVKYYLSTDKYGEYFKFSPDVLKALPLEKA
jgi:hypothetical protein